MVNTKQRRIALSLMVLLGLSALICTAQAQDLGMGGITINEVDEDDNVVTITYTASFIDIEYILATPTNMTQNAIATIILEGEDYDEILDDAVSYILAVMDASLTLADFSAVKYNDSFVYTNLTLPDPAPPGTWCMLLECEMLELECDANTNYVIASVWLNFTDTMGDFNDCDILGIALPLGLKADDMEEMTDDKTVYESEIIDGTYAFLADNVLWWGLILLPAIIISVAIGGIIRSRKRSPARRK